MAAPELIVALLGTGAVSSIIAALLARRARTAEIARLYAERDALRAQAAQAVADAAGALAVELRTEMQRMAAELADARTEIARLRAVIDTLTKEKR
ncbi:hypothetical protein [Longispora albida]|uniref:hypothetical protein n=1 Tax=Longispora albida TaxID=203523 RepID=UPI00036F37D1|nr:hypothetical protein [Longispora albida]